MTLVQSWMDSLTLFKPKNFQLFVMVTIKSIMEAYKLYVRYFWWLIALAIAWNMLLFYNFEFFLNISRLLAYEVPKWLYKLLLLAACFCTRPSIMNKDCAYFREQYTKNILYWLVMLYLPTMLVGYIFPLHIFFILFLADSDGSIKSCLLSLWNGLKMIIFNLPLLVITGVIVYSFFENRIFFFIPFEYPSFTVDNIVTALFLPISVCIYTNIYIKRLHEQFDLYFNDSQ